MIAPIKKCRSVHPRWHAAFLVMLPIIVRHLRIAFRHLRSEAKEEAVAEALANACTAYQRLAKQGRAHLGFPTVLARFAAAQVADGRRVGSGQNSRDVLSPREQQKKQFRVERLDHFDEEDNQWLEAVVEDSHTPVFDQVCFRVDFPAWLDRLSRRNRRIAESLALGNTTAPSPSGSGFPPAAFRNCAASSTTPGKSSVACPDLPVPAIAATPC